MSHPLAHPARWLRTFPALALGAALLLTAAACEGVTLEQVQGVLQNVDSISGEATVQLKDGSTITIDLSQVDLAAVGTVIGAASLEAGDEVTLDVDQDGHAQKVKAHHTEVKGTLTAVDPVAGTVTIERDGTSQTLTVSPTAKIEVGEDEHAALADLTIGVQVEAKVDPSGVVVKLEDDDHEDGHEGADPVKATGTITAVDAGAHTIEVTHPDGSVDTLTVTATTELDLEGPDVFTGLAVGMNVVTKVDPLSGALLKVQEREGHDDDDDHENTGSGNAEQREVKGTIAALDAETQSVTILNTAGVEGTYTLTEATELDLEGDHDSFEGLAVGMRVEAKVNPLTGELLKLDVDD